MIFFKAYKFPDVFLLVGTKNYFKTFSMKKGNFFLFHFGNIKQW